MSDNEDDIEVKPEIMQSERCWNNIFFFECLSRNSRTGILVFALKLRKTPELGDSLMKTVDWSSPPYDVGRIAQQVKEEERKKERRDMEITSLLSHPTVIFSLGKVVLWIKQYHTNLKTWV